MTRRTIRSHSIHGGELADPVTLLLLRLVTDAAIAIF
jgi:hypothetical protein